MKSGDPRVAPSPTASIVVNPYVGFARDSLLGRWNRTRIEFGSEAIRATLERMIATIAEIRTMSRNPKFCSPLRYEYSLMMKSKAIKAAMPPNATARYLKKSTPPRTEKAVETNRISSSAYGFNFELPKVPARFS